MVRNTQLYHKGETIMTAVASPSALHGREAFSSEKLPISHSSSQHSSSRYRFERLEPSSSHFSQIEDIFRTQLEPLYGNQEEALKKIKEGKGRRCEMLLYRDNLIGFIVYKTGNQEGDRFEVKSLVATEDSEQSREDCRKRLLDRVKSLAAQNLAKSVYVTVSEKSPELLKFFTEREFVKKTTWADKQECLLCFQLKEKTKKRKRSVSLERKEDEVSVSDNSKLKRKKTTEADSPKRQEQRNDPIPSKGRRDRPSPGLSRRETGARAERSGLSRTPRKMDSHELTLRKKYIHQISGGGKTIEGRINSGIILRYRIGDRIRFFYKQNPSDDVVCKIEDIRKYDTFKAMLEEEGYQKCLTDVGSLEEAVAVYDTIPGYRERAARHGVTAIHLQLLKKGAG